MDKDLEQGIKKLERGVELMDEEAMHGKRIAQTIEVNEDLEEKYITIQKLKKQVKAWRYFCIAEMVVLVLVLLYVLIETVFLKQPENGVLNMPSVQETVLPIQTVEEEEITFNQQMPVIDVSQIESTTTDALAASLGEFDAVNYLGEMYRSGDEYPSGVPVFSIKSLMTVFGNTKCVYNTEPECTAENHWDGDHKVIDKPIYVAYSDENYENTVIEPYYNGEYFEANYTEEVEDFTNHAIHFPYHMEITLYGKTDIDVESLVKGIIEDYPMYSDIIFEDTMRRVEYTWDSPGVITDIYNRIKEGLSGAEFTFTAGGEIYHTYDSVKEDENGNIVCSRDGENVIPETVKTYHIVIVNYDYSYMACAYMNHWY